MADPGIMVEVHETPRDAMSDADQALSLPEFEALVASLDPILEAVGRTRSMPSTAAASHA